MPDWRETHFGVPSKAPPARRRWWWLVPTVPLLALIGVFAGERAGFATLPDWWYSTARGIPGIGTSLVPGPAATDDPAKARLLRERVASRERGIGLMSRERAEVMTGLATQQRLLDEATGRLRSLEAVPTAGLSPAQVDDLRRAHADAVAMAKNATLRLRQLGDRRDSLDRRMTTAQDERDAALTELGVAPGSGDMVAE